MKYELIKEEDFYRIKALKDFGDVKKGDIGGLIEAEKNLSQEGNAWVYEDARVSGNARVTDSKDFLTIGPLVNNRSITVTKSNGNIKAGCFLGDVVKFEEVVSRKYKGGSDYNIFIPAIKEYLKRGIA